MISKFASNSIKFKSRHISVALHIEVQGCYKRSTQLISRFYKTITFKDNGSPAN